MDQLKRAMPQAMIEAAGGRNIFDDLERNWPRGNWEDVIARDPEWIVIVDYDQPDARGKIDFLLVEQPAKQGDQHDASTRPDEIGRAHV